jgi:hypothetical protein
LEDGQFQKLLFGRAPGTQSLITKLLKGRP